MDNQRTILWALFAAMIFLTWSKWQDDFAPASEPAVVVAGTATPDESTATALPPSVSADSTGAVPADVPGVDSGVEAAAARSVAAEDLVTVETDVLTLQINAVGGSMIRADLKNYPVHKDQPDVPVRLLDSSVPYELISGLVDTARGGPTHLTRLQVDQTNFVMAEGEDELQVPLRWSVDGITVEKVYRFRRGSYTIDVEYRINNRSAEEWRALSYQRIRKIHNPPERSMFNVDSYSFDGPVFYDGEKYEKLDPDDFADEPLDQKLAAGWIASIQHHFLTAAVPASDEVFSYSAKYTNGITTLNANGPTLVVPPGTELVSTAQFFVGPKLQEQLKKTSPGLPLTVDYGILAILAQPLFWILQQVHKIVGNWGWTIILVTFMIKLAFYKLTETSGRSMAKMRKLQPRLKTLQERYKDDRQALSQHMMELYKKEKVNPAAGCLPMLVQIPFFIAFYWVLLESVEMRQAPFALWITDLSSRDPYFVLPLLMGVAMFVQQKLNPAPPDPVQAKVMTILPIMFTVFFAFFPAGLVLYWLTNSVLSVIQQWNINRKMAVD